MKQEKCTVEDLAEGFINMESDGSIVWVDEFDEWKLIQMISPTMYKNTFRVTFDTGETRFYRGNKKFLLM